jgi:hypothetical protein
MIFLNIVNELGTYVMTVAPNNPVRAVFEESVAQKAEQKSVRDTETGQRSYPHPFIGEVVNETRSRRLVISNKHICQTPKALALRSAPFLRFWRRHDTWLQTAGSRKRSPINRPAEDRYLMAIAFDLSRTLKSSWRLTKNRRVSVTAACSHLPQRRLPEQPVDYDAVA